MTGTGTLCLSQANTLSENLSISFGPFGTGKTDRKGRSGLAANFGGSAWLVAAAACLCHLLQCRDTWQRHVSNIRGGAVRVHGRKSLELRSGEWTGPMFLCFSAVANGLHCAAPHLNAPASESPPSPPCRREGFAASPFQLQRSRAYCYSVIHPEKTEIAEAANVVARAELRSQWMPSAFSLAGYLAGALMQVVPAIVNVFRPVIRINPVELVREWQARGTEHARNLSSSSKKVVGLENGVSYSRNTW